MALYSSYLEVTIYLNSLFTRAVNALARLHGCEGSPVHSLLVYAISTKITNVVSYFGLTVFPHKLFCLLANSACLIKLCSLLIFFPKNQLFSKNYFRNTKKVSNNLEVWTQIRSEVLSVLTWSNKFAKVISRRQ